MRRTIELVLSVLFPPNTCCIADDAEALEGLLRREIPMHHDSDPLRSLGYFESGASKPQPKE